MRTYFVVYRSFQLPNDGARVITPHPTFVAGEEKLAMEIDGHTGAAKTHAITMHNTIAAARTLEFKDVDGNIYRSTDGLTLANTIWSFQPIKDHPLN
jgi:hypothetical protein